jgi:hypothetical protein
MVALADLLPPATQAVPGGEAKVQADVRMEVARQGGRIWRNNRGAAVDKTGRQIRFGLGNDSSAVDKVCKSSDLIGIMPGGTFVAYEIKEPGWLYTGTPREVAQANFLALVVALGGIGKFITDVEQIK